MDTERRPSGIEWLGDMSWGTHFCLFYETEQDLLETLALYFNIGLENNEFILWIASETNSEKARSTLKRAIPSADQYLEAGNIEILSYQQWYFEDDVFDSTKVYPRFRFENHSGIEERLLENEILG